MPSLFDVSQNNSFPEALWEGLGSFYSTVPPEERVRMERVWEALTRVLSAGRLALEQQLTLFYLNKQTKGAIEEVSNIWTPVFEDPAGTSRQTTFKEFLQTPNNVVLSGASLGTGTNVYSYRISAVNTLGESLASQEVFITGRALNTAYPITITWSAVPGATGYNVYGRGIRSQSLIATTANTTYTDSTTIFSDSNKKPVSSNTAISSYLLPLNPGKVYLSIPTLLENDETVLTEGIDYEIVNYNSIRFFADSITQVENVTMKLKEGKYYATSTIILSPILYNVYFKIFGIERISEVLTAGEYLPHISGYSSLSNWEKAFAIGEHLKYFCWAFSYYIRRSPNFKNLANSYGLANDYPFAYEAGEVVWTSGGRYLKIRDIDGLEVTYDIGAGNVATVLSGQSVSQFQLLASGIAIKDWYSDPAAIEALVDEALEEKRITVKFYNTATGYNPNAEILASYKKLALPVGLNVKE